MWQIQLPRQITLVSDATQKRVPLPSYLTFPKPKSLTHSLKTLAAVIFNRFPAVISNENLSTYHLATKFFG